MTANETLKIGIFDSGVGGTTIYSALRKKLPGAKYFYCSDSKNYPYGTKSEADVVTAATNACSEFIKKYNLDLLVIACNTASTVALPAIREQEEIQIVGVVPAIKPAAALSKSKVIGLLATPGTIERTYTDKLITSFAEGVKVVKQGSRGLVDIAEAKLRGENVSHADIDAEIGPLFENSASTDLDVVVLGCTHFPILLDELEECSPHKIIWLDSGEAIANRVWEITSEFPNREAPNNSKCKIFFTEMNNLVAAQLESLEKLNMEVEAE